MLNLDALRLAKILQYLVVLKEYLVIISLPPPMCIYQATHRLQNIIISATTCCKV